MCAFELPASTLGYVVVSAGQPRASEFICAPCHDACHAYFGKVPASVADLYVGPLRRQPPVPAEGVLLVVRHPDGFPALAAAGRRLAYEFVCDFPLAFPPHLGAGTRRPGVLEALLHVVPQRFEAEVLLPVVEAAVLVLDCRRVRLDYASAVRRDVASTLYDHHGAAVRRRIVAA